MNRNMKRAGLVVGVSVAAVVAGAIVAAQQTPEPASATVAGTPKPSVRTPQDALSEENVIRERLYFDVTGHPFDRIAVNPAQSLGPCTGTTKFTDVLPRQGVTRIGSKLDGGGGLHVVEQVAQTQSTREARATADEIVSLVDECAAISGGDFGYGDPVTVQSSSSRKVVYFPAYDSDAAAGGYIVFSVGTRVGVVDVADGVSPAQVTHLAKEATSVAAM
ncbi:hypothetical protein EV646_113150 [Kribbella antiqua]|uniref:PknH-like protein n=1 Tax=Kribbella antiqua TaxID=2512217 RepID=A0A4R2IFR9_9ACTN|nr:hypothetical protein [Kribbella antiqua]TCO42528.1 hypothetical protein EV646_113150 [Kribbella antiqua]